jgi:hypothetical protein
MGWKGFVRSVGASARRSQRASEKRARAVQKAHAKADSFVGRLDAEVEREIARVQVWEEKLAADPIKALKLSYDRREGWTTAPLEDQKGIVTYSLTYKPASVENVSFDPAAIDYKGITIAPMGLTVSQYFTAIAFEASPPAQEGGRQLKLVNQKTPENSKIALSTPNGDLFLPTDTSLDGRLFPGSRRPGAIAFEAFTDAHDGFEVVFDVAKDTEPVRLRVSAPTLREQIAAELAADSVVGQFLTDLRGKQVEMKASADRAKDQLAKQAKSGCAILLAVSAGALALLVSIALIL